MSRAPFVEGSASSCPRRTGSRRPRQELARVHDSLRVKLTFQRAEDHDPVFSDHAVKVRRMVRPDAVVMTEGAPRSDERVRDRRLDGLPLFDLSGLLLRREEREVE